MRCPAIHNAYHLWAAAQETVQSSTCIDDKYVPARPLGFISFRHRIKAAWLVFTGRADALHWPGQET
jgi:hypothetical protein